MTDKIDKTAAWLEDYRAVLRAALKSGLAYEEGEKIIVTLGPSLGRRVIDREVLDVE